MSEHHLRLEVETEGGAKRGQAAPEGQQTGGWKDRWMVGGRTPLRPQKWRGNSHFSQRLRAGWLRKVQAVQLH